MAELIRDGFLYFANETGIIVEIWRYADLGFWALLAVGALACLLGIRVYRGYCAAIFFMAIATVTCLLLRDETSWRAVVTCFSVIGVTVASFALFWKRLDACVLCALLGGSAGWLLFHSLWGVIPLALVGLVMTLTFPVATLRVSTALWGGWVLWDLTVWRGMGLTWLLILPTAGIGYLVQRLCSRHQTLFQKVRPDRVTHWMEERERKKQYADRVS